MHAFCTLLSSCYHLVFSPQLKILYESLQEGLIPATNTFLVHLKDLYSCFKAVCFVCVLQLYRDSLHQSLQLVWYLLLGTAAYLPMWEGEQVKGR